MTPTAREEWREAKRHLLAALELEGPARRDVLERLERDAPQMAQRVRELIAAHESAGDFLITGPRLEVTPDLSEELIGSRLGIYRIVERIGQGGMATVYRAVRDDATYEQEVAVKVLRPDRTGVALVDRLRRESQILSSLEHPHIARILDAGATDDGLAYLVMELVGGRPITEHCDRRDLRWRERLELFLHVCDAVRFAHGRLVVHNDLKPSNILVTNDGTPRLLDFGIAGLLEEGDEPESGPWRQMTPRYASPEQLRGAVVGTASDVFTLGVLLRELMGLAEGSSGTRSRSPELSSGVRSDLEALIAKALVTEPERRYATVGELSADVRRLLERRPLVAGRYSALARARRFVVRHPLPVGASVLVGLLAVFLTYQSARLARERAEAEQHRRVAEEVASFSIDLFELADTGRNDAALSARELLDRGVEQARRGLAEDPAMRGRLLLALGSMYARLGVDERAAPLLAESTALLRSIDARDLVLTEALLEHARVHLRRRSIEAAKPLLDEALLIRGERLGADHAETAIVLSELARYHFYGGRYERSRELNERALAPLRGESLRHPLALAEVHSSLAVLHQLEGRQREAFEQLGRAITLTRNRLGAAHRRVSNLEINLGLLHGFSGELVEADDALRATIERLEANGGHRDPLLVRAKVQRANVLMEMGRSVEARQILSEALPLARAILAEGDGNYHRLLNLYALARLREGALDEAKVLLSELETLVSSHGVTPAARALRHNLGQLAIREGRHAEAIAGFERLILDLEAQPERELERNSEREGLAGALLAAGELQAAADLYQRVDAKFVDLYGADHPIRVWSLFGIAESHLARGDRESLLEVTGTIRLRLGDLGLGELRLESSSWFPAALGSLEARAGLLGASTPMRPTLLRQLERTSIALARTLGTNSLDALRARSALGAAR